MRHYFFDSSTFLTLAQQVRQRLGDGEEFWFVSADVRQAAAARREGMPVLDPTA